MSANLLKTSFSLEDRDFSKVDILKTKLTEVNNIFNNFGGSVNFTQKINSDFDELNKKIGLLDGNLKKIGNTDLTGKELKTLSNDLQQQARAQKLIEQAKRSALQTAIEEVKLERQKIGLQRESLALEATKQRLSGKKDLDLKNALSEIRRYQQENVRAEKEITAQLQRESKTRAAIRSSEHKRALNDALKTVSDSSSNNLGENGSAKFGGNSLKLSSFQKQNLSYQINDVLTGLASGQPITQIAAQQSGQIAQIFNPAQAAALVATYGSLTAIAGAGAISNCIDL